METLIDKKTYKTKNFYKVKIAKTQIIITNTLRKDDNHIMRLLYKDFGKSKEWPMFTIKKSGKIIQHFSDIYHSNFMGIKEVDIKSISIVLENMGWLRKIDEYYYNWINESCDEKYVVKKKWLGYEYWDSYTDEQMDSLCNLCSMLCEKHNIVKSVIDFHHYHKDIKKYRGIVLKSNYFDNCSETNPVFKLEKLKNGL